MPESEGHKILGQVELSTVAHSIKNAVKRSEYAIYFKEKNAPGGKRSSEYLCKLNDEAALGRVTTPSENTNLLEEMILGDNFELQSLTNSALKVDAKKTSKLS